MIVISALVTFTQAAQAPKLRLLQIHPLRFFFFNPFSQPGGRLLYPRPVLHYLEMYIPQVYIYIRADRSK
jgi:hypothetical protein